MLSDDPYPCPHTYTNQRQKAVFPVIIHINHVDTSCSIAVAADRGELQKKHKSTFAVSEATPSRHRWRRKWQWRPLVGVIDVGIKVTSHHATDLSTVFGVSLCISNNSGPLDNLAFFLQLTYNFQGGLPRRK